MPNSFASDNISSACPEVMQALIKVNQGIAVSYGNDANSQNLTRLFCELFEKDVTVFPVISGTASNALALATITPSYGKVFCHAMSHINTDECAAPEFFTGGAKLVPIDSDDGKIRPAALAEVVRGAGNVHAAQPATLSITQSCETGTVYQLDEIAAVCDEARRHKLKIHMDGARFSNALVSLNTSPADMTWRAGVDVLSFGGTKNGCLAAEAVVFFGSDLVQSFPFLHKRSGHLLSKMRFVSAQLEAYITDDVWRRNARQANTMAARVAEGLTTIDGIELVYEVQSNEIFAHLPQTAIDYLNEAGFTVTEGELDETAPPRFVTAWNTTTDEVDRFLEMTRKAVAQ